MYIDITIYLSMYLAIFLSIFLSIYTYPINLSQIKKTPNCKTSILVKEMISNSWRKYKIHSVSNSFNN